MSSSFRTTFGFFWGCDGYFRRFGDGNPTCPTICHGSDEDSTDNSKCSTWMHGDDGGDDLGL